MLTVQGTWAFSSPTRAAKRGSATVVMVVGILRSVGTGTVVATAT